MGPPEEHVYVAANTQGLITNGTQVSREKGGKKTKTGSGMQNKTNEDMKKWLNQKKMIQMNNIQC